MGKGSGDDCRPALALVPDPAPGPRLTPHGIGLSDTEQAQLGSVRLRASGMPSDHPYPTADLWPAIRDYLVARSRKANPNLDEALTAYTPGETLDLLEHPTVKAWHESAVARLPEHYDTIVLVPCAKTKPWVGPAVGRSKLYSAYNQLREEMPNACFVTISEPLGIVPMHDWGDFPQYDNPGLFRDDAQRSGMTTKQWEQSPFGKHYGLPFDDEAHERCIEQLGNVVADFLDNHRDRRIVSVVDNLTGPISTHGQMLDVALARTGQSIERHPKRVQARVSPLSYLRGLLAVDEQLIAA